MLINREKCFACARAPTPWGFLRSQVWSRPWLYRTLPYWTVRIAPYIISWRRSYATIMTSGVACSVGFDLVWHSDWVSSFRFLSQLLNLKAKSYPWWRNIENLWFRSQCRILLFCIVQGGLSMFFWGQRKVTTSKKSKIIKMNHFCKIWLYIRVWLV